MTKNLFIAISTASAHCTLTDWKSRPTTCSTHRKRNSTSWWQERMWCHCGAG
ncbi:MAG: hypothetical protein IJV45_11185 [Prevotella sp.]|nr:hypothetical protein [Prevotella sp.]